MKHGTQRDGFFINQQKQILFWNDQKGPAYVLEESDAIQLVLKLKRIDHFHYGAMFFYMLSLIAVLSVDINHPAPAYITDAMLYCLVPLIFQKIWTISSPHRGRVLPFEIEALKEIDCVRPPYEFLKPSQEGGRTAYYFRTLGVIVFAGLVIYAAWQEGSNAPLLGTALGCLLITMVLKTMMDERNGIFEENLNIYEGQLPKTAYESIRLMDNGNIVIRFFENEISWFLGKWKALVLTCFIVVGVDKYFWAFKTQPLF